MDLKGKVVLITGASSGIGADAAVYLASLGAKVAVTGRNEANLNKTVAEVKKTTKGAEVLAVIGDLSIEKDVDKIINETIKKFGQLDVLVNNAGIMKLGPIEQTSLEVFDEIYNTNVRAVVQLTKLSQPYLIKSKGSIINISSAVSRRVFPMTSAYSLSKAALDHFTKCIALELGPKGVRVNAINPGLIVTELQKRSGIVTEENYPDFIEKHTSVHPLNKVGQPREVSKVIAFLASDLASNVTGVTLPVDGGLAIASL